MTTGEIPKLVGARVKRREDPRLITGKGTYVDDIELPRMAHMAVVRSEHAHARLVNVDVSAARSMPGVLLVMTAADVPIPSMPGVPVDPEKVPAHPPLATDKVRHVGDPIAVIIAETRYQAKDAAEAVTVEYDPLPAVVDLERATEPGAPQIHDGIERNIAYYWNVQSGDVDAAFAGAPVTVKQKMVSQRLMGVPLETRAVLADYRPGQESLTLWCATQVPHLLRTNLSALIGMPEQMCA
jgi:carbon-monoxide dehydrogenase large subunit